MNIFYLDKCPVKAAQVQYNKHVVKMILESAQMLCAAHHVLGSKLDIPYKIVHKNHPSTIWTRECAANYSWLYQHMRALGEAAKLMTLMNLFQEDEEYEKCAIIKQRMDIVNKILKKKK